MICAGQILRFLFNFIYLSLILEANFMAKCEICEKTMQTGHRLSINRSQVSRRANRVWKPNVKTVHVVENGVHKTMHLCTGCMRDRKHTRQA